MRDQKKKQKDPFDNKESKTIAIATTLLYDTGNSTFRCTMRHARRGECSTQKECEDLKHITNFISYVEWSTEWKEEGGGITWLELYILYRIHSQKIDVDPPCLR